MRSGADGTACTVALAISNAVTVHIWANAVTVQIVAPTAAGRCLRRASLTSASVASSAPGRAVRKMVECQHHPPPRTGATMFAIIYRQSRSRHRRRSMRRDGGARRPDGHRGATAGGAQAAPRPPALAGYAIAPDVRRILDRARLNFLFRRASKSCSPPRRSTSSSAASHRHHRWRARRSHRRPSYGAPNVDDRAVHSCDPD